MSFIAPMYYERFIAGRYLRSGRFFTSVSTWISTLGITLGVAVVCFVMSMHNGFERELRNRLLGTTSHISIFPTQGFLIDNYLEIVEEVEKVENVVAASPFVYYKAAISSEDVGDGIVVRGIDTAMERRTASIAGDILYGDYTFDISDIIEEDESAEGMIMGSSLAGRMGVTIGDPVVLYSLKGEDLRKNARPRVSKFYITGIFETGMYEFDSELAYISLNSAQKLFKLNDAVTAIHLKLTDIYLAEELKPLIEEAVGPFYNIVPWNELHKNLFAWIALEKKALFIGFILIVLVAAFSIISTLVMLAMEKRTEIGILKTVGATSKSIRKIFLLNGFAVGTVGVICGWLIAIGAAWLQNEYSIISLPGDLYFINYLPVDINLLDFATAGAITIVICLLAALYPAMRASSHSVIDVLRQ